MTRGHPAGLFAHSYPVAMTEPAERTERTETIERTETVEPVQTEAAQVDVGEANADAQTQDEEGR